MAKLLIGTAISVALLASAACSGTSPSGPSTSLSLASPSSTFSSQVFSATGVQSAVLSSHHSEDAAHEDNGARAELEGAIVSIDASLHSLVVRTTTVTVSASTVIRHGHTPVVFTDLKVGEQIHVKGTSDGKTIAATEITVQNEDEDHERTVEAQGVVSGLKGKCPSITFTIGTTNIATSTTTTFRHGACEQVVNGGSVEVTGARQADGSILASRVSIEGRDNEGDADSD
jgi:hypothetical protein